MPVLHCVLPWRFTCSQVLESSSWIFYQAKYDCSTKNDCGGAHLPLLLEQLTDVDKVDTQDIDARLEIKCWTPADARYDGDWVKWKEGNKQLISTVSVAGVALTKVYFTQEREEAWEENGGACDSHSAVRALAVKLCEVRCRPTPTPGTEGRKGEGEESNTRGRV